MLDIIKNNTVFLGKYRTNSEAVIISCFFNPQGSEYRNKAFKIFYDSIKHLPHRIIECVIGDSKPVLPENENIKRVYTKSMLWHKEALLNNIIDNLPSKYKYVFWVDADVIFTNKNWLVDGVKQLKTKKIIQPFEYCVHLEKDETEPSFSLVDVINSNELTPNIINNRVWRSFCANYADSSLWKSEVYNDHGHVGFAWGARRSVLEQMPLYDKALVGGADHIISHAAAGQIAHNCIIKSFTDDIEAINEWSKRFYDVVQGEIGYVEGNLYHIWHGDIEKREYLKRVREFTGKSKSIIDKDEHGLYIANNDEDAYVKDYFENREVKKSKMIGSLPKSVVDKNKAIREETEREIKRKQLRHQYPDADDSFIDSLLIGYFTDSTLLGTLGGGNMVGAMIGDMLNDSDEKNVEFGGGEFGGAGAGGTWVESTEDSSNNSLSPFS